MWRDTKATENLKIKLNYAAVEMNKLQRELKETNEKIKIQESRWTQLGDKLNDAGSKMQAVGKKVQDVGRNLSTKVTAPLVGLGTAAAKMSIGFENSLAKVNTIVDTTQLSMENVKKGVLKLSNETGEGVNDLNEALYQSISAGVESGKSVEFLGSADKTLRQISGKSFAELMASGKSVGNVFNMLNEYANKNNLTLKDMFGSVEAGTASMILAGAGGQDFNKVLDTMSNVAGATDTAFNKVNETTGVALYKNWDTIKAKAAELKKAISEKWNEIKQVTVAVFTSIKDFLNNIWNGIKNITTTVWNSIKTIIANVWNGIKSVVTSSVNGIKNIVDSIWNSIKSVTTSVWNGIKTAITTPINSARDIVKKAIDSIYGFFKNLKIPEIKIPKIKLPHFSLRGEFSLMPPKVPKFDVNWYAQGGIFNAPSIIGVGEAGTEAVLPIDRLDEIIAKSIKKA